MNVLMLRGRDRQIAGTCWPVSLHSSSFRSQSDTVSKIRMSIIEKKHVSLSSGLNKKVHMCACTITYTKTHRYTRKYTYT